MAIKMSDEKEYGGFDGLLRLLANESGEKGPLDCAPLGGVSKMSPFMSAVGETGGTVADTSKSFKISLLCNQLRLVKSSSGSPFSVVMAPKQLELKLNFAPLSSEFLKPEAPTDLLRYGFGCSFSLSRSGFRIGGIVNLQRKNKILIKD